MIIQPFTLYGIEVWGSLSYHRPDLLGQKKF